MVQSATASQQATEGDLRFVRLSVAASVATDYYTLREADAETKILETTIVDLERGYEITNNQFRRGLISELAVRQDRPSSIRRAHTLRLSTFNALSQSTRLPSFWGARWPASLSLRPSRVRRSSTVTF